MNAHNSMLKQQQAHSESSSAPLQQTLTIGGQPATITANPGQSSDIKPVVVQPKSNAKINPISPKKEPQDVKPLIVGGKVVENLDPKVEVKQEPSGSKQSNSGNVVMTAMAGQQMLRIQVAGQHGHPAVSSAAQSPQSSLVQSNQKVRSFNLFTNRRPLALEILMFSPLSSKFLFPL